MSQQDLAAAAPPHRRAAALDQYLAQPVPESDYVLLCAFGLSADAERSGAQLRQALVHAGFLPRATRYLVRSSPLLHRSASGLYGLRQLDHR